MPGSDTKTSTDYLKGIAISAVILGHYIRGYHPELSLLIFGNYFVALFFILSGYGLYFSIYSSVKKDNIFIIHKYIVKRAVRLYPLYWIFYLTGLRSDFGKFDIITFLGFNFSEPDFLWFIPAIIQCYIAAPFLYFALQKCHPLRYLLYCTITLIVINLILEYIEFPNVCVWSYRTLYFSHIYLLAIGFSFPLLIEKYNIRRIEAYLFILLFLMVLSVYNGKRLSILDPALYRLNNILFLLLVSSFSFLFIKYNQWNIFQKIFTLMGTYSYSLYIFHGKYFSSLHIIGLIQKDNLVNIAFVVVTFPILISICALIEETVGSKFNIVQGAKNSFLKLHNKWH